MDEGYKRARAGPGVHSSWLVPAAAVGRDEDPEMLGKETF